MAALDASNVNLNCIMLIQHVDIFRNTMLPILLLLAINLVSSENCSYLFDNQTYSRTSLLTIKGLPTNLVFNPMNNDLLFTLIDVETLQDDSVQTKMDQYLLRNGDPIKIDNVQGQTSAVDVKNGRVYIGSDTGLNVLNKTDKATFIGLKDEDIVQLFKPTHSEDLYAVIYPENEVYIIDVQNNEKKKVENIPCAFFLAVDERDNIYYECDSKYIKVLLKGFVEPIEFVGIAKGSARAIATDGYNRVVLANNDGLYHLRPDNMIPTKLMDLDFVPAGIAFDNDDFYLSTSGIIYKYSSEQCE